MTNPMGCAATLDLAFPPTISTAIEDNSHETLSSLVRRHRALQRLPPSRLARAIDRTKARFSKNPNLKSYQQLVSFMALSNVSFTEKVGILELLQQNGQAFISASTHDLHFVSEKAVFDAVQQQKHAQELTAAISNRDRKIVQLERTVKGLVAARDRCHTNEAALERQLQYIQSWALKLRGQLDELGRIEKTIEDRRQSTPLELPKQDDQAK
ncbi:MAG: hypothetical protein WAN46_02635 [Gammaproteobacteria bacterium]